VLSNKIAAGDVFQRRHESPLGQGLAGAFEARTAVQPLEVGEVTGDPPVRGPAEHLSQIAGSRRELLEEGGGEIVIGLGEEAFRRRGQLVDDAGAARPRPQSAATDEAVRLQPGQVVDHRCPGEVESGSQTLHRLATLEAEQFREAQSRSLHGAVIVGVRAGSVNIDIYNTSY